MSAQGIGNSFYGLQELCSDHIEVRQLLNAMCEKISQCDEELSGQEISNALYGLRGMRDEYSEVRAVLSALSLKLSTYQGILTGQHIGNCLYGLQLMKGDYSEVNTLLDILWQKLLQSNDELNAQQISNGLYGLISMSTLGGETVEKLINFFISRAYENIDTYPILDMADLLRSVSLLRFHNNTMSSSTLSSTLIGKIDDLWDCLVNTLSIVNDKEMVSIREFHMERKVYDIIEKYLQVFVPGAIVIYAPKVCIVTSPNFNLSSAYSHWRGLVVNKIPMISYIMASCMDENNDYWAPGEGHPNSLAHIYMGEIIALSLLHLADSYIFSHQHLYQMSFEKDWQHFVNQPNEFKLYQGKKHFYQCLASPITLLHEPEASFISKSHTSDWVFTFDRPDKFGWIKRESNKEGLMSEIIFDVMTSANGTIILSLLKSYDNKMGILSCCVDCQSNFIATYHMTTHSKEHISQPSMFHIPIINSIGFNESIYSHQLRCRANRGKIKITAIMGC